MLRLDLSGHTKVNSLREWLPWAWTAARAQPMLAGPWCMGFLAAMTARQEAGRPLLDLGRVEPELLLPILLNCTNDARRPCGDRRGLVQKAKRSSETPITIFRQSYLPSASTRCIRRFKNLRVRPTKPHSVVLAAVTTLQR